MFFNELVVFKGSFVLLFQNAGAEASPVNENKIPRDLCNLALRITSHLKWNLEILEEK